MTAAPRHRTATGARREFQAADPVRTRTSAGSAGVLRKYTNAFSVARASLFWALLRAPEADAEVALHRDDHLHRRPAPGHEPHPRHGRQRHRQPDRPTVGLRPLHRVLGDVGARVLASSQQQLADRLAYQIEFDMRVWLYTHIQSADLRRLDQVATGQLVTRSLTDSSWSTPCCASSRRSSASRRSSSRSR